MNPTASLQGWLAGGALALLFIVLALPLYALNEPARLARTQAALQAESIRRGQAVYAQHCQECHAADGRGMTLYPDLTAETVKTRARADMLTLIERGVPNTEMAAWGVNAGGILYDWQINDLITMLYQGDWAETTRLAQSVQPDLLEVAATAPPTPATPPTSPPEAEVDPVVEAFYNGGCVGCHVIATVPGATGRTGPDLSALTGPIKTTYLEGYLYRHLAALGYQVGGTPGETRQISPAELALIVTHLAGQPK